MIVKGYDTLEYRIHLYCINGMRVGLTLLNLKRLLLRRQFLVFVLGYSAVTALVLSEVYGAAAPLPMRFAFWVMQIYASWLAVIALFALFEWIATRIGGCYIVITLAVQVLVLILTLPLGDLFLHGRATAAGLLPHIGFSVFLQHLLVLVTFEFVLTTCFLPRLWARLENVVDNSWEATADPLAPFLRIDHSTDP